jgi:hypothetical protein
MLGVNDDGDLVLLEEADDRVIWDPVSEGVKHVSSSKLVSTDLKEDTCTLPVGADEVTLTVARGPEKLPSEYLVGSAIRLVDGWWIDAGKAKNSP